MYPPDGEEFKFIVIDRGVGYKYYRTGEEAVQDFSDREESVSELPFKPGTVLLAEIVMGVTFYTDEEGHEVRKRYGSLSAAEKLLGVDIEEYLDAADISIEEKEL